MKILLDENLPVELAEILPEAETLAGRGWLQVRNGELLRLAEGHFDLLLTMDKGILYQHNPPKPENADCSSVGP